jgi:hypothetical protein
MIQSRQAYSYRRLCSASLALWSHSQIVRRLDSGSFSMISVEFVVTNHLFRTTRKKSFNIQQEQATLQYIELEVDVSAAKSAEGRSKGHPNEAGMLDQKKGLLGFFPWHYIVSFLEVFRFVLNATAHSPYIIGVSRSFLRGDIQHSHLQ